MLKQLISFSPSPDISDCAVFLGTPHQEATLRTYVDTGARDWVTEELYDALNTHGVSLMLRDTEWSFNIDSGEENVIFVFTPALAKAPGGLLQGFKGQLHANDITVPKNFGKDVDGFECDSVDEMREVFEEYLEILNAEVLSGHTITVVDNWADNLSLVSSIVIYKLVD